MTPPTLILFDVDGTLLLTGGASSRCMKRAGQAILGERFAWHEPVVGRLDHQLFADLAQRCGVTDSELLAGRFQQRYLLELRRELAERRTDVIVLPGVRELLDLLSKRTDLIIGLLTGNFREAAELKLAAAGIDPALFPVGVFAEDAATRDALVATALDRAQRLTGVRPTLDRTILIGDTPRDIAAARAAGCRILAVATGYFRLEQLRDGHPDAVAADLSDQRPLMKLIAAPQ